MAMNLEEEIMEHMSQRMADEIDFGIIADMLISCGWHKIVLTPMTDEHGREIDDWVATKVIGKHKTMGLVWLFEKQGDAVNFTLKWS